jgi:hypothetical protein
VDIHYREARGERCQAAEYRERFPTLDQEWLTRALTEALAAKRDPPSVEKPKWTASEGDLDDLEGRSGWGVIPTRPRSNRSASQQTFKVSSPCVCPSVCRRQASKSNSNSESRR